MVTFSKFIAHPHVGATLVVARPAVRQYTKIPNLGERVG